MIETITANEMTISAVAFRNNGVRRSVAVSSLAAVRRELRTKEFCVKYFGDG